MKKLIFILFAFLAISTATAQPTSNFKTIKLTAPPTGGSNDDILTIGADKVVKKVAKSSIAPTVNLDPLEFNTTHKTVWNNGKGNIDSNTSFGEYSLSSNTDGFLNTAIGHSSLFSNLNGFVNTAIGHSSLFSNTVGVGNIAIGYSSLFSNLNGNANIAIGNESLKLNTNGVGNLAIGSNSLRLNTNGNQNIAIGSSSLSGGFMNGDNNIGLGNLAGAYSSIGEYNGNSSIYIGSSTKPLGTDQTNQIVIGHEAIGAGSNTATLGNTDIVKTVLRGTINTTSMPVYADNAAATAGGLGVGDQYRTSTGQLMVRY